MIFKTSQTEKAANPGKGAAFLITHQDSLRSETYTT